MKKETKAGFLLVGAISGLYLISRGGVIGDGGAEKVGAILGSPGEISSALASAGTGSQKQIAAVTGYMAPGTKVSGKPAVTPVVAEMQPKKARLEAQKTAYIGGAGPYAYKTPESFIPQKDTKYQVIATPVTSKTVYSQPPRVTKLTAKGEATKKKVAERKASGFVSYSGSVTKGTAASQKATFMARKG